MEWIKRFGAVLFAIIFVLHLFGCAGNINSTNKTDEGLYANKFPLTERIASDYDSTQTYQLLVDGNEVGFCKVCFGLDTLSVEFFTGTGWRLDSARVYADDAEPGDVIEYNTSWSPVAIAAPIPVITEKIDSPVETMGQSLVPVSSGQMTGSTNLTLPFEYPNILDTHKLLSFNLPDYPAGTTVFLKVGATVSGTGGQFNADMCPDNDPGTVIHEYVVKASFKLPEQGVNVSFDSGSESTFSTTVSNCPAGYSVGNGTYLGWCVDRSRAISQPTKPVNLLNSFDTTIPGDVQDEDWSKVNYILNHKLGSRNEIQNAIWHFIGGGAAEMSDNVQAMIDEANENGLGYTPDESDEVLAVIVYPGDFDRLQRTVIEVPYDGEHGGPVL